MLFVLAVACASTATPYQPMARNGGYANTAFDSGSFAVTVRVNEHTTPDSADAFVRRRATEVCAEHRFSRFSLLRSTRTFHRKVRWTGIGQGELAYWTQIDAVVRCDTPLDSQRDA